MWHSILTSLLVAHPTVLYLSCALHAVVFSVSDVVCMSGQTHYLDLAEDTLVLAFGVLSFLI
jgi:hypothetical protein